MSALYYGSDIDYFDELNDRAKSLLEEIEFIQVEEELLSLTNTLYEEDLNYVVIDFSSTNIDPYDLLKEIHFLKQLDHYRGIVFMGVFANKNDIAFMRKCYTHGFTYLHIKGDDIGLLLREGLKLGFPQNIHIPRLATANKSEFTLPGEFLGNMVALNSDELLLETDVLIDPSIEDIELSLKLVEDVEIESFNIIDSFNFSYSNNLNISLKLEIPYQNGWDSSDVNAMTKDDLENWIENNLDDLNSASESILVFSNNYRFYENLNGKYFSKQVRIIIVDEIENKDIESLLISNMPRIIFYDINESSSINLNNLKDVLHNLNIVGDQPIVCVHNTKSTSQAMSKIFNYGFIVTSSQRLELDDFYSMVTMFIDKKIKDFNSDFYFVNPKSEFFSLNIKDEFLITEITEHEIEFTSKYKIPAYSILELDLPVPLFLTNTISFEEAVCVNETYRYRGVINGITEKERNSLRRLVNQFIFEPPQCLNHEIIEKLLSDSQENINEDVSNDENIQNNDVRNDKIEDALEENFLGKEEKENDNEEKVIKNWTVSKL